MPLEGACGFGSRPFGKVSAIALFMTDSLPAAMREAVAARIMRNIEWADEEGAAVDTVRFLNDIYAALRHRLEHEMLFGVCCRGKHDKT